jgi:hypothetical protein
MVVAIGIPRKKLGISEKASLISVYPRYLRRKNLLNHPHIRPVIFELMAAVEADYVVLAGGRGDVPA